MKLKLIFVVAAILPILLICNRVIAAENQSSPLNTLNQALNNNQTDTDKRINSEPWLSRSFDNIKLASTKIPVKLKLQPQSETIVTDIKPLKRQIPFKFENINFKRNDNGTWNIDNLSPAPINTIPISYDADKTAILNFSQTLPGFSSATLDIPQLIATKITYNNQTPLFTPVITNGTFDTGPHCQDKSIVCSAFAVGDEVKTYDITTMTLHNVFNRKSFEKDLTSYFEKNCSIYSDCVRYKDKLLPYATRNFLILGQTGQRLYLRVMRNRYLAEGTGAGTSPNINEKYSTNHSKGGCDIWYKYIDKKDPRYRNFGHSYYSTMFHEISHAYNLNHRSGMTYGYANHFGDVYLQNTLTRQDYAEPTALITPPILMKTKKIKNNEIEITFDNFAQDLGEQTNINLEFISAETQSFDVNYQKDATSVKIHFNRIPTATLLIRASIEDSDFISTIKIDGLDTQNLQQYKTNGKTFTDLNKTMIIQSDNGWNIRKRCKGLGELATKAQYQEFWNYAHENHLLNTLHFKQYLSKDEPKGYTINLLKFNQDNMNRNFYSMYKSIGNDKGLMCVRE